jgi:predicted NAD/FAD-binding protein
MSRVAVVGSGVAGLGAAWALSQRHQVVVYEADGRLGGHAHTVEIDDRSRPTPVDTGFIVFNPRNYPNLVRLFDHLDVPTEPSTMSFAVSLGRGRFEYQARALGLVAQPSNLAKPTYLRMIADIVRFAREAASTDLAADATTREFLDAGGYSESFRRDFLLPMLACIWSSSLEAMLEYPARSMIRFLDNHGLLDVLHRPRWRTVTGGSREYVRRLSAPFAGDARLSTPVVGLTRDHDGVRLVDANGGADLFDDVVFATHADTTLQILGTAATDEERRTLSAFTYQRNVAVLHRDPALMPRRRRVWSSWNYLAEEGPGRDRERVSLSYWMNSLQNLETQQPVIVTLNPSRDPRGDATEYVYDHPQYDGGAVDAQARISSLQGVRHTWFAGSYCGYGFHEDALRSGLEVAASLGAPAPWMATERQLAEVGAR